MGRACVGFGEEHGRGRAATPAADEVLRLRLLLLFLFAVARLLLLLLSAVSALPRAARGIRDGPRGEAEAELREPDDASDLRRRHRDLSARRRRL